MVLITAKPRTGKSTLIKKVIEIIGKESCNGFYTEEIIRDEYRIGFEIHTLSGERAVLASIDLETELRLGRYGIDLDVFEKLCIGELKKAFSEDKLIIIDEIGPMQMYSKLFQNILLELEKSEKNVIGTIFYESYPWIDEFKLHKNAELIELTEENRDGIAEIIASKVKRV